MFLYNLCLNLKFNYCLHKAKNRAYIAEKKFKNLSEYFNEYDNCNSKKYKVNLRTPNC